MFLLQIYPSFLKKTLQSLLPLMINTLTLDPYPQQRLVPQEKKNRHKELIAAQIKTLSFIVYLLRGSMEYVKPFEGTIANSIFSLLLRCPEDSLSTRKDLLIATKHVISSPDFRKCLFPYLDDLLNEQVLLGPGRPESIRHLGK
jgi:transformation/transcription domain-associated protein